MNTVDLIGGILCASRDELTLVVRHDHGTSHPGDRVDIVTVQCDQLDPGKVGRLLALIGDDFGHRVKVTGHFADGRIWARFLTLLDSPTLTEG